MNQNTRHTIMRVFFFCLLHIHLTAQEDLTILRFPALSPDGNQIALSYQGDIWTVDANGGTARRLTIHESYESHPQWSPDGQNIVFQGNRYGNNDIFSIKANGSRPMRLTHHSTSDSAPSFDHQGNVLFTTRRNFIQVEREQEIHQVSATGGTPFRLLNTTGFNPKVSPNGRFISFIQGNCRLAREAYTGPANRNILLYDTQNKTYQTITNFAAQDVYADWGNDQNLYFLSAKNGRYNIYQIGIDANGKTTGEPTALTNFTDEGIRYFDVSQNGQKIVFSRGTSIYTMNAQVGATPQKIAVQVTEDYRFDPIEHKTYTKSARDYAISPNGKYLAIEVRGELFVTPNHKDRKRTVQITKNPARDQDMTWLNDSTLIFISDRNGNKDVFLAQSADTATVDLFKTFKLSIKAVTNTAEEETQIALSPDRKKLVMVKGRGKMVVADISANGALSNEITLLDGWDIPEGIEWSPDSKWLAYAYEDLNFNEEIYIHAADGKSEPHNVSMHPRGDYSPKWSADGSKLGFVSIRNNGDADLWFVWLKKEDWEKTKVDWEESEYDEPEKKDDKEKDKKKDKDKTEKVEPIQIDFDNIYQRIVQVTRLPGNEGDLVISKNGETFFFTTFNSGRAGSVGDPEFMKVKWDGSELKTVLSNGKIGNISFDKAGKKLYYIKSGGTIANFKADADKPKPETLPFSAKMDIHHAAERTQVFEETWRSLNAGFYDPQFHGQSWTALRDKYKARALAASTSQDFRDMTNEMLGQLNASHMGLYGSSPEETQRESTGLLGIEVMPLNNGVKITKVIANSPASRTESTLNIGDIITAVNGATITNNTNFYSLLQGTRNEKILLSIIANNGSSKEVIIRPTSSLRRALYDAWVNERKALTEKYSNGKLGYLHIQGMNWTSFERFERELAASGYGKEGIVIDVRFNGGGWTTDMLMAVLNVRQHSYTVPRGAAEDLNKENKKFKETYPYGERLPLSSWTKPSIALCNQNSYSNAEIFSHAFKTLDIGTLVGTPTFGAVISTGGQGLIDGSFVRMPFRAWYVKATGENMEHGPAVPDVIVENAPDSKANGDDPQLKKSVEILLSEME